MATDNIENLVAQHAQRLGIDPGVAIDNAIAFADVVGILENDGELVGKNPQSSAKGLYQFLDDSIDEAVKRTRKYVPEDSWMSETLEHRDANKLDWEQQTLLFLGDMLEKEGSDEEMRKVLANGDVGAMERAYYKFHHTKPDTAAIKRTQRILYGTEDKN